jgi:hypothetical protein
MDEAEIVKGEKLERMSITLMNHALKDPLLAKMDPRYFSVQSKDEIWPVGTFRVIKESNACLKWVLDQTPIPELINAQNAGQKLVAQGIGEFSVEWHLACDIKTIKSLYGFGHGANSTHYCIYCWQKKATKQQLTAIEAREPWRYKRAWNGGLFAKSISSKPTRGPAGGSDGT